MSLTTLIGDYSSYASLDEADSYFLIKLDANTWDIADSLDKKKALIQATKQIDRFSYRGNRTDSNQPHEFPRNGDLTIPKNILEATCEIAYALLDGFDPDADYEDLNTSSYQYAEVTNRFQNRMEFHHLLGLPSNTVFMLLSPFMRDPRDITI